MDRRECMLFDCLSFVRTYHSPFTHRTEVLITHSLPHRQRLRMARIRATSTSAEQLPEGVDETKEKTFIPPANQRGEGQASPTLKQYLRSAVDGVSDVTAQIMMVLLFLFFFLGVDSWKNCRVHKCQSN